MGLPGAGKTTLAKVLAAKLNAVNFNADEIRANINKDLGFSLEDRIDHATRMGWLADRVTAAGCFAIADFICPTVTTRAAFASGGEAFVIFVDRVEKGHFEDTNKMFEPPVEVDLHVTAEGTPEAWAEKAMLLLRPVFDPKRPTALFLGRYQPFHDGHKALVLEGLRRVGQVCIAVRDTAGTDASNPFGFEYVRARIEHAMREYEGRFHVITVPNITSIFYGRDVGYSIERIDLDAGLQAISATQVRRSIGIG